MNFRSSIRKLFSPRTQRTIRKRRRRHARLCFEALEVRTLLDASLTYQAAADTPLTLRLAASELQIVDSTNPSTVFASESLANLTDGVLVEGNGFNVNLTVDSGVPQVPGGVLFAGGSGTNTLVGPGRNTAWRITGAGEGSLGGPGFVSFMGVENLTGAADNQDTFFVDQGGSLSGTVEGGAGGYDTVVFTGAYGRVDYAVTGAQSGDVGLDGQTVRYAGMEPIQFLSPVAVFTHTGTDSDDVITLRDIGGDDGVMEIFGTSNRVADHQGAGRQ
jgi:hypothetical protein